MRLGLAALSVALCAATVVGAEPTAATWRGEWLAYASNYRIDQDSVFNPANALIRQAENVASSELRPDFAWSDARLALSVKPRWLIEAAGDSRQSRLWLNEANVRWRAAETLTVTAGREVLLWGPAQFWNPSNPFYTANGKSNAKRELPGKGFARARWQFGENAGLAAIAQLDNGAFDLGAERVNAAVLDWVGDEASAAAIVAAQPGEALQWRGWAQWTADDATLLYGEAAWVRSRTLLARRVAVAAGAPGSKNAAETGWQVVAADSAYALDALVGAAYTFANGWTLNAEFYHHGSGLDTRELADWGGLARDVGALASSRTPAGVLAASQIAAALDPQTAPLGRRLVGVQLRNGSDETVGWNLRYSRNVDDGSAQAVVQLSADLGERWQLWANVVVQRGGSECEYGRWLDTSAMLGVTAFLW